MVCLCQNSLDPHSGGSVTLPSPPDLHPGKDRLGSPQSLYHVRTPQRSSMFKAGTQPSPTPNLTGPRSRVLDLPTPELRDINPVNTRIVQVPSAIATGIDPNAT